jgi:Secretion system C-terminal sorting domain
LSSTAICLSCPLRLRNQIVGFYFSMRFVLTLILIALGTMTSIMGQDRMPNTVYQVGDTLYLAVDRLPANPRLIHSNLEDYWDFTGLMAPYVQEIYVRPGAAAQSRSERSAYCVVSNGDGVDFSIVVDGKEMWISGIRMKQGNDVFEVECLPHLPLRVNTNDFGSEKTYSGTIEFNLTTDFVAAMDDSELSLADSIRIVVDWKYEIVNDQEGQMQLESGHYDVLRQQLKKTVNTQTEIKQNGMWSVRAKSLPFSLPIELQTGTTYIFWSEEFAEPVAVVQTDESENAVRVTFKVRKYSGRRVVQAAPDQADIFVHPNPSFGMVRFDLVNLPADTYQIEIYNILGVRLRSYSLDVDGSMSYPLNLSDLKKGTYIYRLVDSYLKTLRSKRIVIITP